eukprot:TRINITY_DN93940_c0_g1_i1.p1 TRINITY_DN93940_c0_g1~~TRINITY_DN93940_c0_g1_i1.p1  ORF type:complete len:300 (-),score=58.23 TRINITY_DN93940_c0_g1_i1:26-925(-)
MAKPKQLHKKRASSKAVRPPTSLKKKASTKASTKVSTRSRTTPPASWKADYPVIKKLRKSRDAPVDSVGCERLADRNASKATYEWQCLVSAMLSSMTRDQANAEAMAQLSKHGNNVKSIANTSEAKIKQLIIKVGFPTVKAKCLKAAAKICLDEYKGRIPNTLEGLMALPGVGPKMAHLVMHAAFDEQKGICVDSHVHRISNALGWVKTKTPEETRVMLESWLPKKEWPDINVLLVGFGQQQQQASQLLLERCCSLGRNSSVSALRILQRLGVKLKPKKNAVLDALATKNPYVEQLLEK